MDNIDNIADEVVTLVDRVNNVTLKVTKGEIDELLKNPRPKTYHGLPVITLGGRCYPVATSREKALAAYRVNIKNTLWNLGEKALKEATGCEYKNLVGMTIEELQAAIDKHYGLERFLDKCMENPMLYFDALVMEMPCGYSLYPISEGCDFVWSGIAEVPKEELDARMSAANIWNRYTLPHITVPVGGRLEEWLIAKSEEEVERAVQDSIENYLDSWPAQLAEITGVDAKSIYLIMDNLGDKANGVLLDIVGATCGLQAFVKWMRECHPNRGYFLARLDGKEVKLPCGYLAYRDL